MPLLGTDKYISDYSKLLIETFKPVSIMTKKKVLYGVAVLFAATLIGGSVYINSLLPIITGF